MASKETKETTDRRKALKADVKGAHFEGLDELVNVNSLFTVAVFLGLSIPNRDHQGLETRDECQAGLEVGKRLIVYEVVAFSCFLLSSLLAKVIKLHLYLHDSPFLKILGTPYKFVRKEFDLKDVLLVLAGLASVAGMVLVLVSVVQIIQLRIGLISCGSSETRHAVWALCLIVGVALVIYAVTVAIAIYASIQSDVVHHPTQPKKTGRPSDDNSFPAAVP